MAEETRHITEIYNTDANLQTNLDNNQRGIQTDGDKKSVYVDNDGAYHVNANSGEAESFTTLTVDSDIIHAGDTDTKIGFTTNIITLTAGNSAEMIVTAGVIAIVNNLSVDTDTLYVDATNNRVGIGTVTPAKTLHVRGGDYNTGAIIVQDTGDVRQLVISSNGLWRRDTDEDNTAISINAQGYNDGVTRFRDFLVYDGKGSLVLAVDGSASNVGINTGSPSEKLHVAGNILGTGNISTSSETGVFQIGGGSATTSARIKTAAKALIFEIWNGAAWTEAGRFTVA